LAGEAVKNTRGEGMVMVSAIRSGDSEPLAPSPQVKITRWRTEALVRVRLLVFCRVRLGSVKEGNNVSSACESSGGRCQEQAYRRDRACASWWLLIQGGNGKGGARMYPRPKGSLRAV
jgi:hypothetical protein